MNARFAVLALLSLGCTIEPSWPPFEQLECTERGECFDAWVADAARDMAPDAAPDGSPDVRPMDGAPPDMPPGDMRPPDMRPPDMLLPDMRPPDARPPVARCADIDSVECFGHPDCPAEQRCENVGPADAPVPCCVPGARGMIPPGGSCAGVDGQIECASGVCIEDVGGDDLCSGVCEGPDDCPASLPRCTVFPFGGSPLAWCFPD